MGGGIWIVTHPFWSRRAVPTRNGLFSFSQNDPLKSGRKNPVVALSRHLELVCPTPTQSPGLVAAMSTSVAYLRKRLADIGRTDLLRAAERGEVSFYAASEAAGLVRRRAVQGNGSRNAAKQRQFRIRAILREANGSHRP
jgi:hypothetical protein